MSIPPFKLNKKVSHNPDEFKQIGLSKISGELYMFVLKLAGEYIKPEKMISIIKDKFGETTIVDNVAIINKIIEHPDSKLIIGKLRTNYLNKIKDVEIAHKRIRLDDLEYLRQRYLNELKKNMCLDDAERNQFRQFAKGLNDILSTAREEIEGKGMTFNQLNVIGDFNDKSDDELAARRDELIKQAERALVGGAVGINYDPERAEDAQVIEPA